jgi:DNA-binding CsgD family transcriptional regulator
MRRDDEYSADSAAMVEATAAAYAAGAERAPWRLFLAVTAALLGAASGQLLTRRADGREWRIEEAANLPPVTADAYNSRWAVHDTRLRDAAFEPGAPTVHAVDVSRTPQEPFRTFFLESGGARHILTAASGDLGGLALVFWRADDRPFGPDETLALQRLWPHVVRARGWAQAAWRPDASTSWLHAVLDLWHLGVVGLAPGGRPVYANRTMERMAAARDGLGLSPAGPMGADAHATQSLREAVRRVALSTAPTTEWLRLRRRTGARPYEVALRRLETGADEPAVVMVVGDPDASFAVDIEAIQRLHGLAPLEARVAASVSEGASVAELMRRHDLSINTVRWYVQRVREKLEVERQQDMLRLIVRGVIGIAWSADQSSGPDQIKVARISPPK